MRAIFFGTPGLAVPTLKALNQVADVVQVICQPDKRSGRGMKLRPPPVKVAALELGLDVVQPKRVKTEAFAQSLVDLKADVAVVIAYGRILPLKVLEAPRRGCVNIHASLLPRLRGAGPIQWSIVRGDSETGVCLMLMDEGMDTGPVIARASTPIDAFETAGELGDRLAAMGAELIDTHLQAWVDGKLGTTPQDGSLATHAPLLSKEDGRVDWRRSAQSIHNQIRGFSPWPGAHTELSAKRIKIHQSRVTPPQDLPADLVPGTILLPEDGGIHVFCGENTVLELLKLQAEGKKRLDASAFRTGQSLAPGASFLLPLSAQP